MGLDNYAVYAQKNSNGNYNVAPNELFKGIELAGGLFSGGGASFRGKIYDDYVFTVTQRTLYQEFIPPEEVKEMAMLLQNAVSSLVYEDYDLTKEEAEHLARWFKVCADNGFAVCGWW